MMQAVLGVKSLFEKRYWLTTPKTNYFFIFSYNSKLLFFTRLFLTLHILFSFKHIRAYTDEYQKKETNKNRKRMKVLIKKIKKHHIKYAASEGYFSEP